MRLDASSLLESGERHISMKPKVEVPVCSVIMYVQCAIYLAPSFSHTFCGIARAMS
jgi:hypothetical protein